MDQLTKEFFANEFPGFAQPIRLTEHVLSNDIPVVELDLNINFPQLMPIELCKQLTVPKNVRYIPPYETTPRMAEWNLEILWSDGTVVPAIKDVYNKMFFDTLPYKDVTPQAVTVKSALEDAGFNVRVCWISSFGPGGYVRPHRDIALRTHPLTYFWIPINNPKGSVFKTYPYGTINVNLGCMYLFNQENFTHAVYNNSDETRYALLGYFDSDVPKSLTEKILQAIKEQYQII